MPESTRSSDELQSNISENSESEEYPTAYEPPAQPSTTTNRRPSLGRRISNAASNFLGSLDSRAEDELMEEEDDAMVGINQIDYMAQMYGTDELRRRITTKDEDEEEQSIKSFRGQHVEPPQQQDAELKESDGSPPRPPIERRRSSVATVVKKYSFWDEEFKNERVKIFMQMLVNYFFLLIGFAGVLCIYIGSYYKRDERYKDLKMAVVIADQNVGQLPNIVGQTIEFFFTNVSSVQTAGNFDIWNYTRISELALARNNTITEEVYRQVHHQKYWAAFYVHENATLDWFQALATQSQTFDPTTSIMEAVYSTGRDYNAVNNYIITIIRQLLRGYTTFIPESGLVGKMLQTLNSTQAFDALQNSPQLITTIPTFFLTDLRPVTNPVAAATLQLGGVYTIVITFFSLIFSLGAQMAIAEKVKGLQYVMFKLVINQVSYLFVSLGFICLNTAFQLPFNRTFGHSGFLVIWMFAFLLMSAVGSMIELMVLIAFAFKPPLLGFVLVYSVVINLSPTISPIDLCPKFYRYGYAIPLRNFYDLLQVAYFDAWKGHMGRNIGVLIAWIAVSNISLPFVMRWLAKRKAKQAAQNNPDE
ncbi:SNG1 Nitrosoguanidine resistance protein SNG1 [Candida maltosa Xu316]